MGENFIGKAAAGHSEPIDIQVNFYIWKHIVACIVNQDSQINKIGSRVFLITDSVDHSNEQINLSGINPARGLDHSPSSFSRFDILNLRHQSWNGRSSPPADQLQVTYSAAAFIWLIQVSFVYSSTRPFTPILYSKNTPVFVTKLTFSFRVVQYRPHCLCRAQPWITTPQRTTMRSFLSSVP